MVLLRSRAALPCSDEASGRPRAMINHWLRGWLAGGPRWSLGGCDYCWVLLQEARRAVVCPVHEATWPVSRASYLLSWCVLSWSVCCRLLLSEWMNLVGPNGLLLFRSPAGQSALPLPGWQSWYAWLVSSYVALICHIIKNDRLSTRFRGSFFRASHVQFGKVPPSSLVWRSLCCPPYTMTLGARV